MRTLKEILIDWVKYLGDRKGRVYSDERIKQFLADDVEKEAMKALLIATLEGKDEKGYSSEISFYVFCNIVLKEDPATGHAIWNEFVKKQFNMIEKNRHVCYMAARGHGKSFVVFALYPLFKTFCKEGFESLLCSNIPKMAKRNLRVLKRLIETNELLLEKKDTSNMRELTWSTTEIEYNHGFIETISMGSTPRSAHVDYAAADDPLRDDKKYTDEYIMNFVQASLRMCTIRKKGRLVVVGCVSPDTRVLTEEGLVKIGELVNYDENKKQLIPFKKKVFGKDEWDETSDFFVNGKVKTNKIVLENGYELECSEIHPLWSCPKNNKSIIKKNISWIKSDNLELGDWIAIKSGTNIFGKEKLNTPAYLLGLYIAEGSSELKGRANRITITNKDESVINYLKKEGFHNTDGIHNRLNSKELINNMKLDGVVFTTCHNKRIPEGVFRASRKEQINFLRGLYDGDGHSTISKVGSRNKNVQVVLTAVNKLLLLDVQQILLNFGIISSIQKSVHKSHHKKDGCFICESISFKLTCSGIDAKKYLDEIGFKIGYKNKVINFKLQNRREYFGFVWKRIKRIEKSENHTVDFVIPKSHSFISNGLVSHNTPQHEDDLFHELMREEGKKTIVKEGRISGKGYFAQVFPGILDMEKKTVLVPEIFTFDELMEERRSIGDMRFQREIMCRCTSHEGALISRNLFVRNCDEELGMLNNGEKDKKYLLVIDSATSDAPTADFCAMSVWEVTKEQKLILRHLWHEKGYPINDPNGRKDDQIHVAYRLHKDFNNATIVIETNSPGISVKQGLEGLGCEVIQHVTQAEKINDVVSYIEALKSSKIKFPADPEDEYTLQMLEKVKIEHLSFGVKKGKNGESYEALAGHDDIFDTCWMAWKQVEQGLEDLPLPIVK